MSDPVDPEGRGVRALLRRLTEESDEWQRRQRLADAAKKRRAVLIAKAVRAGVSSRRIGAIAHLSSPGVGMVARRAEQELADD